MIVCYPRIIIIFVCFRLHVNKCFFIFFFGLTRTLDTFHFKCTILCKRQTLLEKSDFLFGATVDSVCMKKDAVGVSESPWMHPEIYVVFITCRRDKRATEPLITAMMRAPALRALGPSATSSISTWSIPASPDSRTCLWRATFCQTPPRQLQERTEWRPPSRPEQNNPRRDKENEERMIRNGIMKKAWVVQRKWQIGRRTDEKRRR